MYNVYGSGKFELSSADGKKILKGLGYSLSASLVAFIIAVIPQINIPAEYAAVVALIVPTANTALHSLKLFLEDRSKIVE